MASTDDTAIAGRYVLDTIIGRGGAGAVWRGRDVLLDRPVAVKVFATHLAATAGADGSTDHRRALREARLSARLQHPGAVAVYDIVEHEDRLHLVMELVEAPDLAVLVEREGPLPPTRVAGLGLQLLDVLEAAHAIGVIHRDVKPSNVLVTDTDRARLTDFGTAILSGDDRLTALDVVIGSPAYMSPEQATERDVGPAADLWSLGATLYHAVEGSPPFGSPSPVATMHKVIHDPVRPAARSGALGPTLDRLLQKSPQDRATVDEARLMLQDVVAAEPVDGGHTDGGHTGFAPPVTGGGGRGRRRGASRWLTGVGAALLLAVAVGLALTTTAADDVDVGPTEVAGDTGDDPTASVAGPEPSPTSVPTLSSTATPPAAPEAVVTPPTSTSGPTPGDGPDASPDGPTGQPEAPSADVPEDWVVYDPEDAPYRLSHPPTWNIERLDATRTDISDPGSGTYLRLDWTADPAPDPLADWQSYERSFAEGHEGYERIRMDATTFDGEPAALWEYRYRAGGATLHAYNLNVSGSEYGYALNFQTADGDWSEMEPLFTAFRAGYDIVD